MERQVLIPAVHRYLKLRALLIWAGRGTPTNARPRNVDFDGHSMRVEFSGLDTREPGSPVVVFEAGTIPRTQSLEKTRT